MTKARRASVPAPRASVAEPESAHSPGWLAWLGTIAIALAGFCAFAPGLNGDFVWDDYSEIVANREIKGGWEGLRKIWVGEDTLDYFPLKSTVQWLQWQAWGERPYGYRATNVALHVMGALLVWRLFAKLGLRCAWAGGFLFAVHPLAVESAGWIAELKNVLSLPLLLLSAICYLNFTARRSRGPYAAALGLFLAAMLCKSSVAMFPLLLLLHAWWQRGRIGVGDLRAAAPFFGIALVLGLVTIWFQHERAIGEWHVESGTLMERLGRAGMVLGFYFGQSLAPIRLLPIYPRSVVEATPLVQLAAWLTLIGGFAWCWRQRRSWGRHALLGLGWFVLNLLPVLGFIKMSFFYFTWVSDHFAYVSLVGVLGLVTALVSRGWSVAGRGTRVSGAAFMLALGGLAIAQTRSHAANFTSEERLWRYTLQHNPEAWLGHSNLAASLLRQKRYPEALRHAQEAVRMKPNYASAHFNIAAARIHLGHVDEALAAAARADAHGKPAPELHLMLANGLLQADRIAEAIEHCEIARRAAPDDAKVHQHLAIALYLAGRVTEAIPHYERALRARPDPETRANYGVALAHVGRFREAIAQYEQALRETPDSVSARYSYGVALAREKQTAEALQQFETVLRLNPAHPEAHYHRGALLAQAGQIVEAEAALRAALRLKPDLAEAREQLRALSQRRP